MSEKKSSFYAKILAKLRGIGKKKPHRTFGVGATPQKAIVPAFASTVTEPTESEVADKKAMDDRAAERDAKNAGLDTVPELKAPETKIPAAINPAPARGQRWKDNDPRVERYVKIVDVSDASVDIFSEATKLTTSCKIERFTTKSHTRSGFTYVGMA